MLYGNNNNNNSKLLNAHIYLLLLSGIPRALETKMRDTVTLSSDLTSTTFQKKKIFIIQIIFLCAGLFFVLQKHQCNAQKFFLHSVQHTRVLLRREKFVCGKTLFSLFLYVLPHSTYCFV